MKTLIKVAAGLFFFTFLLCASAFITWMVISDTGKEIIVPNVVGQDFSQAFDILNEVKLKIRKESHFDDLVPENTVVSQSPPTNARFSV